MRNVMKMVKTIAKANAPDADWLKKATQIKEIAQKARPVGGEDRPKFEKLPRLDCRQLKGTEEDPVTILVKALNDRHEVKTERMERPMHVFDAEVILGTEAYPAGKYAIWENTTVLTNEMADFAGNETIEGKQFIIASYGTVPSKKNKKIDIYIFKVIEYNP